MSQREHPTTDSTAAHKPPTSLRPNYKRSAGITLEAAGFCSGPNAYVGATVAHPYHGDCDLTSDSFNSGGVKGHGVCKGLVENFGSTHIDARLMFSATP